MEIKPMGIARNKVWIIYILDVLKFPLQENQLAELCDRFSLMDCFDFSLAINELQKTDLVKCEDSPLGRLYSMSMLGESTLECFAKELSYTKRQEVAAQLKRDSDDIFLKSVIGCETTKLDDGRYRVRMRMIEKGMETFDVALVANDGAEALKFTEQWKKNAMAVYEAVFLSLGRKND